MIQKPMKGYFSSTKPVSQYEADLNKVYMHQEQQGKPYGSRKTFFVAVKMLFVTYDKRTKDLDFWGILKSRVRGAEAASDETILDRETIKNILSTGIQCKEPYSSH